MKSWRPGDRLILILSAILIFGLFTWTLSSPFFWDTISQSSKRPNYFYTNGFDSIFLPLDLDSGHPTIWNLYIALGWKIFGKSLFGSHLLMLPFLVIIYLMIIKIYREFCPVEQGMWPVFIVFLDPTFLAQCTLVSSDLALLAGLLLGFWGVYKRENGLLLIGLLLLLFTNLRGSLLFGSLVLFQGWVWMSQVEAKRSERIISLFVFGIPVIAFGVYLWQHYLYAGWLIISPSENWAGHRQLNSLMAVGREFIVIGWKWLDFGRVFYMLPFGILILWYFKKFRKAITAPLQAITISLLIALMPAYVLMSNPVGHRYLLPLIIFSGISFAKFLNYLVNARYSRMVMIFVFAMLIGGNFWIYPDRIAQGWDASLAYLPYFELREKMNSKIKDLDIDPGSIGTGFPLKGNLGDAGLVDYTWVMPEKDFKQQYLLYSNVSNDFTDDELEAFESEAWFKLIDMQKMGIRMTLYERRKEE